MRSRLALGLGGALLAATGCADLSDIQGGVCGNGVIEGQEDCDSDGAECGQPGTVAACRYTCAATGACAAGYVCSPIDQVCRRPKGELELASAPTSTPSRVTDIADFDGDGRGDVLATSAGNTWVHYHGENAAHVGSTAIPGAPGTPIAGVLSDTPEGQAPRASFALAHDGIYVVMGEPGRVLAPKSYAPFSAPPELERFVFMDVDPDQAGQEIVGIVKAQNGIALGLLTDGKLEPTFVPGVDGALLPRYLPVGDFDGTNACEEMLVATEGAKAVQLIEPCPGTEGKTNVALDLPLGLEVAGDVHVGYLNQDTKPDVFVSARNQAGDQVLLVGYGVGNGRFHSNGSFPDPLPPGFGNNKLAAFDATALAFNQQPVLAAGDLNADGKPDFVMPSTIVMSGKPANAAPFCPGWGPPQVEKYLPAGYACVFEKLPEWNEAQIGYFNDDLVPDVVGHGDASHFELMLGAGNGLFNTFSVSASGRVMDLRVGDADGDLVQDFVFIEKNELAGDSLGFSMGRKSGAPEAPIHVTGLGSIEFTAAGRTMSPNLVMDGTLDIGVVGTRDNAPRSAAMFFGSPERFFVSPFYIEQQQEDRIAPARRAVIGDFDGQGPSDLAVLTLRSEDAPNAGDLLWVLPSTGAADLTKASGYVALPQDLIGCASLAVAADLDGQAPDEVVIIGPIIESQGPQHQSKLIVARTSGGELQLDPSMSLSGLYFSSSANVDCAGFGGVASKGGGAALDDFGIPTILAVDLDGDQDAAARPDVLATLVEPTNSARTIGLFRNDGSGKLAQPVKITLPSDIGVLLSFAVFNFDADPQKELLLLTSNGAHVADLDLNTATATIITSKEEVAGSLSVRAGDIDGDGVDDLAFGGPAGVRVMRGVEARR